MPKIPNAARGGTPAMPDMPMPRGNVTTEDMTAMMKTMPQSNRMMRSTGKSKGKN